MVNHKHILAIDAILILGSLLLIAGIVGYSRPLAIAPLDESVTTNTSILFEFKKADYILIDDNLDFTSPEQVYVKDFVTVNLEPGTYYWKAVGALSSEVRQLTIESVIDLQIRESENGVLVVNSGNLELEVSVYNQGVLSEKFVVDVSENSFAKGDKFIGVKNVP